MIRGKKINFFIGYLNEDVFILLNTCNYMGLFVKVSPKGDKTLGWIRVNYDIPYCANKITQAQYNKCKELNIKVREEDVLWQ